MHHKKSLAIATRLGSNWFHVLGKVLISCIGKMFRFQDENWWQPLYRKYMLQDHYVWSSHNITCTQQNYMILLLSIEITLLNNKINILLLFITKSSNKKVTGRGVEWVGWKAVQRTAELGVTKRVSFKSFGVGSETDNVQKGC